MDIWGASFEAENLKKLTGVEFETTQSEFV